MGCAHRRGVFQLTACAEAPAQCLHCCRSAWRRTKRSAWPAWEPSCWLPTLECSQQLTVHLLTSCFGWQPADQMWEMKLVFVIFILKFWLFLYFIYMFIYLLDYLFGGVLDLPWYCMKPKGNASSCNSAFILAWTILRMFCHKIPAAAGNADC